MGRSQTHLAFFLAFSSPAFLLPSPLWFLVRGPGAGAALPAVQCFPSPAGSILHSSALPPVPLLVLGWGFFWAESHKPDPSQQFY